MSGVLSIELPGLGYAAHDQDAPGAMAARGSAARDTAPPCYVAGEENRLVATAIARLIAAAPSGNPPWNTVALTGPVGCGKSHLARGVAEAWRRSLGDEKVMVTTAAEFRQQLDYAIQTQSCGAMRAEVRGVRMLVIEDLHRLHRSAHVLEELRATMDELRHRGAVLVATATRPLSETPALDRGVLTRFAAGMMLEVAPLSAESRAELLRQSLRSSGCLLERPAAQEISSTLSGDARRVLGAASRLRDRFGGLGKIDQQRAQDFLADEQRPSSPPLRDIAAAVARYYRMPLANMRSSSRKQPVVLARAVAIYLARQVTPLSYDEIGQYFGGRDHSTVMHNHQRIETALPKDHALRSAVNELRESISHNHTPTQRNL